MADGNSINELVKKIQPHYFINFAAQSFVGASWKIPEYTFDIDALGVIRCLEALHKNCPDCRFYNAGSSEEFGDVLSSPQDETHPARARSVYGAAKIAARQIVKTYRDSYGMYAVQGYLFNHESERRGTEFVTRKISLGVAQIVSALKRGSVVMPIVLGNLDAKRDWSHVEDFIDGVWRMLNQDIFNETLKKKGRLLNPGPDWTLPPLLKEYVLSSNETHSIREFIEEAFKVANLNIKNTNVSELEPCRQYVASNGILIPNHGNQINYVLDNGPIQLGAPVVVVSREFYRPAEVEVLHGDSSLARKELGWEPKIDFKTLVHRMVSNDINYTI